MVSLGGRRAWGLAVVAVITLSMLSAPAALAAPLDGVSAAVVATVVDGDGTVHRRYTTTYFGLPVLGGDFTTHVRRDGRSAGPDTGRIGALRMDRVPAISTDRAARQSRTVAAVRAGTAGQPRLVVDAKSSPPRLAWETVVSGQAEDGQSPSRVHVVLDARDGVVIRSWDDVESVVGTGHSHYSGSVSIDTSRTSGGYALVDPGRAGAVTCDMGNEKTGCETMRQPGNTWGDGTTSNRATAGVDAHYGTARTFDYYLTRHNYRVANPDGSPIRSRVHFGNSVTNAYWDHDGAEYGDGKGNARPLVSLDVVGHELTHGVIKSVIPGGLEGEESGALNEATGDIFGAMVEFDANNPADAPDYTIGELVLDSPLRYMFDPARDGRSDSCWSNLTRLKDIHLGAGIADHAFFALAEGTGDTPYGVSPTCGGAPDVTGIGRDLAARVWFRALNLYFTSGTAYVDNDDPENTARAHTLRAASDIDGLCGRAYRAVQAAWTAVGVLGVDRQCDSADQLAWTVPLPRGGEFVAHDNGSLTVVDCGFSYAKSAYTTIDRDHRNYWTSAFTGSDLGCWRQTTPGVGDAIFGQFRSEVSGQLEVLKLSHGLSRWRLPLGDYGCPGDAAGVQALDVVQGAPYALLNAPGDDCRLRTSRLVRLDPYTGTRTLDITVGPYASQTLDAYDNGLVLADSNTIERRSTTGAVLDTITLNEPGISLGTWRSVTPDGQYVGLAVRGGGETCPGPAVDSVLALNGAQTRWRTPMPTDCREPIAIAAHPDGGAVTLTRSSDRIHLSRFDAAGVLSYDTTLAQGVLTAQLNVDRSGAVIIETGTEDTDDQHAEVIVRAPNNSISFILRTSEIDNEARTLAPIYQRTPLTAPGRVYMPTIRCDPVQWCNVDPKIYAYDVPELQGPYARTGTS